MTSPLYKNGKTQRPRKYGNRPTVVDGIRFDSAREAARWGELELHQRAGLISDLERQVKYTLTAHGQKIGSIVPDFRYREGDQVVVEDVKSKASITRLFLWKAKHFEAEHGIKIRVVT